MSIRDIAKTVSIQLKIESRKYKIDDLIECQRHCSWCCHQIVTISIYEAIRLAFAIHELDDQEIQRIALQAERNAKSNNRIKLDNERWQLQQPCALLKNQECLLYSSRPIVCQMSNSMSKDECQSQFETKNARGHDTPSLVPPGTTNELINFLLSDEASRNGLKHPDSVEQYVWQIDLDKLVAYATHPSKDVRKIRLKKLSSYDKKTIKALKKRSINQYQYDVINARNLE